MASASEVKLACLCGNVQVPGALLQSGTLPVARPMCHCNACRRTTGSLGVACSPLVTAPSPETLLTLTTYASGPRAERLFCRRCGCHCFTVRRESGTQTWLCLSGIVQPTRRLDTGYNVVSISEHIHVRDTIDGGMAVVVGRAAQLCATQGMSVLEQSPQPQQEPSVASSDTGSKHLEARCHCGGVSFSIERPDGEAHSSGSRLTQASSAKYTAYVCACRSCKLTMGVSLVPFVLVPVRNVLGLGAAADDTLGVNFPGANMRGRLGHYWSSPNVCRTFCMDCGASVYYWNRERPDELDIAVGILRGQDGAMCRSWLNWVWGRCSFTEETTDDELTRAWTSVTSDVCQKDAASEVWTDTKM